MPITDNNAIIQALANVRLASLTISPELWVHLNTPPSKRPTTEQLLAMIRAR